MYAYHRKVNRKKAIIVGVMIIILCAMALTAQLYLNKKSITAPIIKGSELVITLPNEEEKIMEPFQVEAGIVLDYFDGSDHEVKDYTNFAGVYRPNQGIDYAYNGESFDVVSMSSGDVSEVKNDENFGNTLTITSGKMKITYQSLDAINFKVGDKVKQSDVLGKASVNVYNPELGNHLHLVVENNGKLIDPKSVLGKDVNAL